MQCTSFLPGCYSTRDLNVGANGGTCPLYDHDRTLKSGHSYNGFLPPSRIDEYLGYDKDLLRQTMLNHEATFRQQVHELHRLYRRQRELMVEIKRRELSKHQLQLQTPQSNPFLSQNSSEYPQKMWQIPSLHWLNPAGSRPSVLGTENFQAPTSFYKWMQAGSDPVLTDDSLKDERLLKAKCKRSKRVYKRMLDLELPADVYIDSEEGEGFGEEKFFKVPEGPCYPQKRMSEVLPKSDLELLPCSGLSNSVCQGGSSRPDLFSRRANDLADLNEPIQLEEARTPNSVKHLGSDTYHREIPCQDQDLTEKSTSSFQVLSKEIIPSIQTRRDVEACSKFICLGKMDRPRELLLPHNGEAGQSRSSLNSLPQISSARKLAMPLEPLKVEVPAELTRVNLLDKCERKLWSEQILCSLETSERNHDLFCDDNPGPASSCMPSSHQLFPQSDVAKSEPSSFLSRRKPICSLRQNPIAVQALPCFNIPMPSSKDSKSSVESPGLDRNKFHLSRNLRCSPSVGSVSPLGKSFSIGSQLESRTFEACPLSISINHLNCNTADNSASELHNLTKCYQDSECKDVNSAKVMDLNFMPPICLLDTAASQKNVRTAHGFKKPEDLFGGLPWLRAKQDYSGKLNKEREDLTQMDSGFSQALPTSICDVEAKRFETSDCTSNEKIIVSSNFNKTHVSSDQFSVLSSPSNSHLNPSEDKDIEKVGVCDTNLACNAAIDSGKMCTKDVLVVEIGLDNKLSGVRNHIDLNSCINDDESFPTCSVPCVVMEKVAEIDLEAPVSPENKECSPPRGESEENQLVTPLQLSKQEHGCPQSELLRMAAEAIVSISSSGFQKLFLENTTCKPSESSPSDSLHWFAGVVSSLASDLENEVGVVLNGDSGDHEESSSDGSDYFEVMTLKLTEAREEEYCCMSNGQKERSTILSPSQPRRGRMRRGRQWKDFQTEVLPCLASLSRHEVTEDLQAIGGLMEAVGTPLGLGRKNGCGRGRRRPSNSPSNVMGQQSNDMSELALGKRSLTGWGKTNRRRRGPRFPASNPLIFSSMQC